MIDIGQHIVADMDLGLPENMDVFHILAKHNFISQQLAEKLEPMTGMRNILVHGYLGVDRRRIYAAPQNDLGDFDEFIAAVLN